MSTPEPPPSNGVLHTPGHGSWRLRRWDPPSGLAAIVGCGWATEWDLPAGRSHLQAVLPHPCANLVVEDSALTFHGPAEHRFDRTLTGTGRVVGIRFRPGVVHVLTGLAATDTVDRSLPGEALGLDEAVAARVDHEADTAAAVQLLFSILAEAVPGDLDGPPAEARDTVELVQHDDSLRSVDALASRAHRSRRTLARLFADHVGLGPSWVIRRYRLHRALEHTGAEAAPDWAEIAGRVGYYDQAHLVRDFSATVGTPPARYRSSGTPGNENTVVDQSG